MNMGVTLPSRRVPRVDGEDGVQLARPDELAERAVGVAGGGGQEQRPPRRGATLEDGGRGRGGHGRVAPECRVRGQFRIWPMLHDDPSSPRLLDLIVTMSAKFCATH